MFSTNTLQRVDEKNAPMDWPVLHDVAFIAQVAATVGNGPLQVNAYTEASRFTIERMSGDGNWYRDRHRGASLYLYLDGKLITSIPGSPKAECLRIPYQEDREADYFIYPQAAPGVVNIIRLTR